MRFSYADTDRADEIQEWQWTWFPEDTLAALDLLLVYLGYKPTLSFPAQSFTISPKVTREAPMHRALHRKAVGSALALIHPGRRKPLDGTCGRWWFLYPGLKGSDPKIRIASAGLDADTIRVIDLYRWGLAWNQLTSGFTPTYSQATQEKLVNSGAEPVVVKPYTIVHRSLTPAARRRLKKEAEENEQRKRTIALYSEQAGFSMVPE